MRNAILKKSLLLSLQRPWVLAIQARITAKLRKLDAASEAPALARTTGLAFSLTDARLFGDIPGDLTIIETNYRGNPDRKMGCP
jgi:hypothetical protein